MGLKIDISQDATEKQNQYEIIIYIITCNVIYITYKILQYTHSHTHTCMAYYEELAHMIIEVEKFHDLPSVGWTLKKA